MALLLPALCSHVWPSLHIHCLLIQELWEKDFADLQLEFDIPFRELGFHGVPHRCVAVL